VPETAGVFLGLLPLAHKNTQLYCPKFAQGCRVHRGEIFSVYQFINFSFYQFLSLSFYQFINYPINNKSPDFRRGF